MNRVMNAPPKTRYSSATPTAVKIVPANSAVYKARRLGRPALARVEGRTCMTAILARGTDARNGPLGAGPASPARTVETGDSRADDSGTSPTRRTAPDLADPLPRAQDQPGSRVTSMTPVPLLPPPIPTD